MRVPLVIFALPAITSAAAATPQLGGPAALCTPTPRSPRLQCGVRGGVHYKYPSDPELQRVSSLKECAYLCQGRSHFCNSFVFDEDSKLCKVTIYDNVVKDPKSSAVFYEEECFDCGINKCRPPFGRQLLANGDFEEELLGPWYSKRGRLGPGRNSKHSYLCHNETGCILGQNFNACEGQRYAYRFDYKVPEPAKFTLGFVSPPHEYYDEYHSVASMETNKSTPWRTIAGFVLGTQNAGLLQFRFNGPATYLLDNVHFSRFPRDIEPEPDAVSIVENGDFENGLLGPWEIRKGAEKFDVVSPGLGGSRYALRYRVPSDSCSEDSVMLIQNVTTTPQVIYLLEVSLQLNSPDDKYARIIGDIGTGRDGEYTFEAFRGPTGASNFLLPVVSMHDSVLLRIRLYVCYNSGEAEVLFDNIAMREVPQRFP